jgi:hypothetical protein
VNQETGRKFFENERPCSHVTLILQEVPGGVSGRHLYELCRAELCLVFKIDI